MKYFVLLIVMMTHLQTGWAQNAWYHILSSNSRQMLIDIDLPEATQNTVETPLGKSITLTMPGATPLLFAGCPDLPKFSLPILIPNQSQSLLTVESATYTDQHVMQVAPSKGQISRAQSPSSIAYTYGPAYTENQFFPSQVAALNTPYVLRDFRGQTLRIQPLQYNPITKLLRQYTHLRIRIDFTGTDSINVLSSTQYPDHVVEEFDGIYANHFINYKTLNTRYSPKAEVGSMLIVSPAKYLNEITPFRDWKEQKGIPTFLVNLDTLSGGVTENTISNLAAWYYQNKEIAYMVFVGDAKDIPAKMSGVAGPSDIGYAYVTGNDHYPEFIVGRFSGDTMLDIRTQVLRSLNYEKTPNTSSAWMRTQIGIGSEEGTGDDNQYDWEHIHDIVDSNKNQYKYLTNVELYDGINPQAGTDQAGNPNITSLIDGINNGASLINYCGHGSPMGLVTTGFESSHVPYLSNVNKLPFLLTVGCRPGSFHSGTCFAETMQRAGSTAAPFGSIACFMSTIDQWWDEPMQAQDEFNAILRGARPSNLKSRLGAMCVDACMSMADQYDVASNPNGPLGGSDMTDTWVFFGDPSLPIYTSNEGALSLSYDVHIQQNRTSYEVHCPVDGATIGLYYQGKYLAASTAWGGTAYFTFPALTVLDTVYITATKQNYTPAFGKATVVNWPTGLQEPTSSVTAQVYPNPVTDWIQVRVNGTNQLLHYKISDLSGQVLAEKNVNSKETSIDMRAYAAGLYTLSLSTSQGILTRHIRKD
jgi:hypothetical protein